MHVFWYIIIGILFGIVYLGTARKYNTDNNFLSLAGNFCISVLIWPVIVITCIIAVAMAFYDEIKERRFNHGKTSDEEDWDE